MRHEQIRKREEWTHGEEEAPCDDDRRGGDGELPDSTEEELGMEQRKGESQFLEVSPYMPINKYSHNCSDT